MARLIPQTPQPSEVPPFEPALQQDWAEVLFTRLFLAKILLARFWWIILVAVSVCLAVQSYRALTRAPEYVSTAQMIVSGRLSLPEGSIYSEELANFFGTQITILNSNQVRERAAARVQSLRPELKPVSVSVSARQAPNTSVFVLTAIGASPEYTQAYLDAVMHEYLAFKRQMRSETADRTFVAINEEVIDLQNKIERGENEKVDFQKQNNVVFIQQQGEQLSNYLTGLTRQLSDARTQLNFIDSLKIDSISNNEGDTGTVNVELLGISKDFLATKEKLNQLVAERDEAMTYMKPTHPRLAELNQEIERTESLLQIYRRQSLSKVEEKKKSLVAQIENLEAVIDQQQVYALDYNRRIAEYDRINSRLERQKKVLDQLLSSIQSINLNLNVDQESVSIMQDATVPQPSKNKWLQEFFLAIFLGFFLGGGVIVFIALVDMRMVSIEDISRRFEEPVMGVVPWQKGEGQAKRLLRPNDQRVMLAEACKNVRSSLIFSEKGENSAVRTLMITSSIPGEGKSTISSQLAVTFAFTSTKVLFVDADLRKGHQYETFNTHKEPGFADLLLGKATIDEVIYKTENVFLDFIPTGRYPDNPGELLVSSACDRFLEDAKKRYDYVIFDSAPVLASDDTPGFATKVDSVLFVIRSAYSRTRQVKLAMQNLLLRQANVCGFVLNGFDARGPGYYYYKYREYYVAKKSEDMPDVESIK